MFPVILIYFALQVVFTVGVIFLFGWLIALCNKQFYANFLSHGRTVCYATGFIGTPLHELSHALMCIIFGHKIVEIKLFQISDDGTLGYVSHTYNKRNIYQRIGNFFIGVAPVLVISAVLYLIAYFLLSPLVTVSGLIAQSVAALNAGEIFANLWKFIQVFFLLAATWQWWVFIAVGILFALHMTLSNADIKGALSGLIVFLIVLFITDIILGFVSANLLVSFTRWVISAGSWLFCIMLISLIISLIALAISFIVRLILRKKG